MKANLTARMLLRFLGHIAASAALAGLTLLVGLFMGALAIDRRPTLRGWSSVLIHLFPSFYAAVVFAYVVLFLIFLFVFQWRWYRYLSEISVSLRHIADGHFQDRLHVRHKNQLGDLALHMNGLVDRLQQSVDDERQAEQTKNELVTSVSHDLRTPLTSIIGYLGLIEQDRYRDEVELRHYVQIAYDKSLRLNLLINDLFEYTRMRHAAVPMNRVRFNLTELLAELLVQFRVTLEESGMEGRLHAGGRQIHVTGDPGKLVRVFENLLANAIQYGREGRRIDIRVREEEGEAVVSVVNYGEPIPSSDLPRLFDRFYRVERSRAEHTGGSGLGLAIAKSIIERHGGAIGVTSDADLTAFIVRLPAAEQEMSRT